MASIDYSEEHGGLDPSELQRLGISPAELIDFSVNSNPFGPARGVLDAIQRVDLSAYPDRSCTALREALAQANRVSPRSLWVGNGTAELIWLAAQAFLKPGDRVLIAGPTFGEYRRAAAALGAQVIEVRAQPPDFLPPLEQLVECIEQDRPRLTFVCNPNNPTGKALDASDVLRLVHACGSSTILILDEAYRAFFKGQFFAGPPAEACLVLRSMTKDFALAGLRLGYALGTPEWIDRLRQFQPAWSVNAIAQAAGCAALRELDTYQKNLAELKSLSQDFFAQIRAAGFAMVPSDVHFGLVHAGGPARDLRLRLLNLSLQVRDCASFGLDEYIRISTRTPADNLKLVEALQFLRKE